MQERRQVLFIQGAGDGTHDEWDNRLVENLARELGPEYDVRYPRMPDEDTPRYARWKVALEGELEKLGLGAILVGHSVGGTILLRLLAEQPSALELGAVVLISAPFVGPGGWPSDDLEFFDDLGPRLPKGVPVHFYHGLADEVVPSSHVDLYARAIPQAQIHRLRGRDHQLNNQLKDVADVILSLEADRSR